MDENALSGRSRSAGGIENGLAPMKPDAEEIADPSVVIYLAPSTTLLLDGQPVWHKGAVIEYRSLGRPSRGIIRLEDDRVLAFYAPEWEMKRDVVVIRESHCTDPIVAVRTMIADFTSRGEWFYVDGITWDDIDPAHPALPSGLAIPGEL